MKLPALIALLESGAITSGTRLDCPGAIVINGRRIGCQHPRRGHPAERRRGSRPVMQHVLCPGERASLTQSLQRRAGLVRLACRARIARPDRCRERYRGDAHACRYSSSRRGGGCSPIRLASRCARRHARSCGTPSGRPPTTAPPRRSTPAASRRSRRRARASQPTDGHWVWCSPRGRPRAPAVRRWSSWWEARVRMPRNRGSACQGRAARRACASGARRAGDLGSRRQLPLRAGAVRWNASIARHTDSARASAPVCAARRARHRHCDDQGRHSATRRGVPGARGAT